MVSTKFVTYCKPIPDFCEKYVLRLFLGQTYSLTSLNICPCLEVSDSFDFAYFSSFEVFSLFSKKTTSAFLRFLLTHCKPIPNFWGKYVLGYFLDRHIL